jgi:MmyB-like transcription regulator ligand binding domain
MPRATVLTEGAAAELLTEPINALRLAVHPDGMGSRVENLPEWGRHIIDNVRAHASRSPDPRLDALLAELERYVPPSAPGPEHIGFAVPLRLRTEQGTLRLITTLTSFATATDVTLAELQLEAYLPADAETERLLRERSQSHG